MNRAKGVLMDSHGIPEAEAFTLHPEHGHDPPDHHAGHRPGGPGRDPRPLTGPQRSGQRSSRRHSRAVVSAPMADDGPLFLLDGNSLVFRAFFALPIDLATRSGRGDQRRLRLHLDAREPLRDHAPERHRRGLRPARAHLPRRGRRGLQGQPARDPRPPHPQFSLVRQVLGALGLRTLEVPGYEADDILATLATEARDVGRDVVVGDW